MESHSQSMLTMLNAHVAESQETAKGKPKVIIDDGMIDEVLNHFTVWASVGFDQYLSEKGKKLRDNIKEAMIKLKPRVSSP